VEEDLGRLLKLNWKWVSTKSLPLERDVIRVWAANAPPALRQPTSREHAFELFQLLQQQPRFAGKWILTTDLENAIYPHFVACLGWAPRPWLGRNGVAKHLANLTRRRRKRVEIAGATHNWTAFYVPDAKARRAADSVQLISSVCLTNRSFWCVLLL
jgi:hypothetical protein